MVACKRACKHSCQLQILRACLGPSSPKYSETAGALRQMFQTCDAVGRCHKCAWTTRPTQALSW